jgi:hypothetical protein
MNHMQILGELILVKCDECGARVRARKKCENHYRRMMRAQRGRKEVTRWTDKIPDLWVIPEDGIVDELAVELAASGERRVRLTHMERRLATARILTHGGTPSLVYERLGLTSMSAARSLVERVRGSDIRYR